MSMNDIIETMARHEELISRLYETYSDNFHGKAEFWKTLAMQEMSHAGWLRTLAEEAGQGRTFFKEGRFKIEPLYKSLEYLEQELKRAEAGKMSLTEALAEALQIEQGMIEKKYFEVFETDSASMKHVLQDLADETKKHITLIRDEQAKLRSR